MNIESRRICSACRLAKCLSIGMSRDLIRKEDLSESHLLSRSKLKNNRNVLKHSGRMVRKKKEIKATRNKSIIIIVLAKCT